MASDRGEWKERGVGELKILRHNVTAKYRVLMRYSPQARPRLHSLSIAASRLALALSVRRRQPARACSLCPSPPASSCLLSVGFVLSALIFFLVSSQSLTQRRHVTCCRREQVLKICANHHITGAMTLARLETSEKTYTWSAIDFSEQQLKRVGGEGWYTYVRTCA